MLIDNRDERNARMCMRPKRVDQISFIATAKSELVNQPDKAVVFKCFSANRNHHVVARHCARSGRSDFASFAPSRREFLTQRRKGPQSSQKSSSHSYRFNGYTFVRSNASSGEGPSATLHAIG